MQYKIYYGSAGVTEEFQYGIQAINGTIDMYQVLKDYNFQIRNDRDTYQKYIHISEFLKTLLFNYQTF